MSIAAFDWLLSWFLDAGETEKSTKCQWVSHRTGGQARGQVISVEEKGRKNSRLPCPSPPLPT